MVADRRHVAESTEAVVIGGGVIGCAVLLELALRGIEAVLLEAEPDVGEGTSKANSAILHTGFDARPGTVEARLLRRSAERWPSLLDDLGVPSLACGALMLARTPEEARGLDAVAELARAHGVDVELVDAAWLRLNAPYVTEAAVRALLVPNEGIVDPFWLTRAYAEAAIGLGAEVRTGARVTAVTVDDDGVRIAIADDRVIRANQAFDCAGLRADDIARLAGDTSFAITPRKGEFLVSERTAGVDRIVLPIPGPLGKGMLVTPIVFGGVLLGPTADDGDDKSDRSTTADGRRRIIESCRGLVPGVDEMAPIRSFAGLRSVSSTGDYVIRPSTAGDRLTIVAGIRSTGISASPAIGEAAVDVAAAARHWPAPRVGARATAPTPELAASTGAIVCVCRSVGEAEVAAALAGPMSVGTTDALKRRSGVGFGDCQGNRCTLEAIDLLASARGVEPPAIEKGPAGSWLVTGPGGRQDAGTEHDASRSRRMVASALPDGRVDLVVVGGGLAGIGASLAAADGGLDVVVLDRGHEPGGALASIPQRWWTPEERDALRRIAELVEDGRIAWLAEATVAALDEDVDGWAVEAATPLEAVTVRARTVLLATGGYVMPREHSPIDGPRPSGVMTADLAGAALDRSWLPARRAVVVGAGRLAAGIGARLEDRGATVVRTGVVDAEPARGDGVDAPRPVSAVRGHPRLTGVLTDGEWIDADGLVLADRLQPATFLLRGLGIGDERPGIPAPVDGTGRLALPGLWAAGTCVDPDVDHRRSLDSGSFVARAILAAAVPVAPAPSA